ncbi:MAG: hypothetical protein DMG58_36510 [Acidobacteria bacterium]|nr:MAG: hypothetical protein DMG58_36510 [Acidobacteriota bacterium]
MVEYPTLLDFPPPVLQAYPRETVIAEKLEALTALGLLNSFEGAALIESIVATFRHRGTKIEAEPIGLTNAFYADPARTIQWRAFIRRSHFVEESGELERLVAEIRQFALPVLAMAADETPLKPAGSLAGRGNERVTSFTKVVWGSEMTDQVSDIGNPSYSRVHSGFGEAFCVCRGAESFTTFSTHAELPSVE